MNYDAVHISVGIGRAGVLFRGVRSFGDRNIVRVVNGYSPRLSAAVVKFFVGLYRVAFFDIRRYILLRDGAVGNDFDVYGPFFVADLYFIGAVGNQKCHNIPPFLPS